MRTRLISGIIGIVLFLALCFSGVVPFTLGVVCLAALGTAEFLAVYRHALRLESPAVAADLPRTSNRLNAVIAWLSLACPLLACAVTAQSPVPGAFNRLLFW